MDSDIYTFDFKDLPPIQSKVDLHFSGDTYVTNSSDELKIPKLEQLMEEFPEVPFNMELKHDNQDLRVEVHKLIKKYNRESITIWGSTNEEANNLMRRMAPDVPTFTPVATIMRIFVYFFIGYLPFYSIPHDTFQFPFMNADYITETIKGGSSVGKRLSIFGLQVYNAIALLIFYHLRSRRIYVFYYNINTEEEFEAGMKKGIDGIITDAPEVLVNHLNKKQS